MNSINTFFSKAKEFFFLYKWVLLPLVPAIIFVFMIIYLFAAQSTSPKSSIKQQNTQQISQSPVQNNSYQQSQVSVYPNEPADISPDQMLQSSIIQEADAIAKGKLKFADENQDNEQNGYPGGDEVAEGSNSTKTLPNGSTEYEYPSDDPNRPHMQIINNDTVVFRRNIMPNDTTMNDYSDYLSDPEYTSQGSSYYGATAVIYATPSKGIAVVANSKTKQVYEQYLFPAMSVSDYLQKFGKDISSYSP